MKADKAVASYRPWLCSSCRAVFNPPIMAAKVSARGGPVQGAMWGRLKEVCEICYLVCGARFLPLQMLSVLFGRQAGRA